MLCDLYSSVQFFNKLKGSPAYFSLLPSYQVLVVSSPWQTASQSGLVATILHLPKFSPPSTDSRKTPCVSFFDNFSQVDKGVSKSAGQVFRIGIKFLPSL